MRSTSSERERCKSKASICSLDLPDRFMCDQRAIALPPDPARVGRTGPNGTIWHQIRCRQLSAFPQQKKENAGGGAVSIARSDELLRNQVGHTDRSELPILQPVRVPLLRRLNIAVPEKISDLKNRCAHVQ